MKRDVTLELLGCWINASQLAADGAAVQAQLLSAHRATSRGFFFEAVKTTLRNGGWQWWLAGVAALSDHITIGCIHFNWLLPG